MVNYDTLLKTAKCAALLFIHVYVNCEQRKFLAFMFVVHICVFLDDSIGSSNRKRGGQPSISVTSFDQLDKLFYQSSC